MISNLFLSVLSTDRVLYNYVDAQFGVFVLSILR